MNRAPHLPYGLGEVVSLAGYVRCRREPAVPWVEEAPTRAQHITYKCGKKVRRSIISSYFPFILDRLMARRLHGLEDEHAKLRPSRHVPSKRLAL